jgi:hypothetical protein
MDDNRAMGTQDRPAEGGEMTDGGHSSDYCFSTVSDAYMAHGHAVLVAGTIFKSDLHFHNQAGQHYHRIDELDIPDLDAAIERWARKTGRLPKEEA